MSNFERLTLHDKLKGATNNKLVTINLFLAFCLTNHTAEPISPKSQSNLTSHSVLMQHQKHATLQLCIKPKRNQKVLKMIKSMGGSFKATLCKHDKHDVNEATLANKRVTEPKFMTTMRVMAETKHKAVSMRTNCVGFGSRMTQWC